MALQPRLLADEAARRTAISDQARSLLVEAGAGSGKTAVLAGRIATLLAEGVEPWGIVAVTFTEFAASELFLRVRRYVEEMAHGRIPVELRAALPGALSDRQLRCLGTASAEIDEMIRRKAETGYHPSCSCGMGTDDLAVVDPECRVRGLSGLRVVDSSIFPSITSGNLNAPSIMVGEKAADLIRAAYANR